MKNLFAIIGLGILLSGCSNSVPEQVIPADLEGKKALLKEKRTTLKTLETEIATLEKEIGELDPNTLTSRTLVTTAQLKRQDFKRYVEIQGTIQSDDYISASSEVSGIITELKVEEGQSISKGQLIARLDLEQLEKQVAELQTSLELAVELYERQKRLWDQNIGSEIQYLQAKNNKERLEKSLESLEFQQGKSQVYAPISGVVDRVLTKSGELAAPGMPIVQILNTNNIKVVADVPENYLRSVRRGDRVEIQFPALQLEKKASISLIGRTIDPSNRTFEVEAHISNSGGLLKPNLLAVMLINDFTARDAVVVPLEVVQQEVGGKDYVYVVKEGENGSHAHKVYVSTGKSYQGEIIIEKGLDGTEVIIMDGARGLAENELISIQQG